MIKYKGLTSDEFVKSSKSMVLIKVSKKRKFDDFST